MSDRRAEVGAVYGGVNLIVVRSVREGEELVLKLCESWRPAHVEDLTGFVARGQRACPGDPIPVRTDRHGR